jgi:hypothetical protein
MVHPVRPLGKLPLPSILAFCCAAAACGAPPPCTSSALCQSGTVCSAEGSCAPLDPNAGRFSRSLWIPPNDWGATARRRLGQGPIPDSDVLLIGGQKDREFHMAFGPLPESGSVSRAVLVLAPHRTWTPPSGGAELRVFVTRPFRGSDLTRRDAPRREPTPATRAALAPGSTRVLRMDLTDAVAAARVRGATWVFLAIAAESDPSDGSPLRFASPRNLRAEDRPRLELSVR